MEANQVYSILHDLHIRVGVPYCVCDAIRTELGLKDPIHKYMYSCGLIEELAQALGSLIEEIKEEKNYPYINGEEAGRFTFLFGLLSEHVKEYISKEKSLDKNILRM